MSAGRASGWARVVAGLLPALLIAACGSGGSAGTPVATGPALVTSPSELDAALNCPTAFLKQKDPVLLIHGTGANTSAWAAGYVPQLSALGYDVCTVTLPEDAWGDVQVATEYAVNAVRQMKAKSGRKVVMIGHSQGSLIMRWAIRWWPDVRADVANFISLAAVNHGTPEATAACILGFCRAAAWQMKPTSQFLSVLGTGDQELGPFAYTNLYSETDTTAVPPTSEMDGATNISVQQLCPGRKVAHADMVFDAAAWALVLDALSHSAAANAADIDPSVCSGAWLPGLNDSQVSQLDQSGSVLFVTSYLLGQPLKAEPALMTYADGSP